ncbi:MAG: hypothetical protein K0R53_1934, partial [Burkholderiales bacterium]|jgi:hypothetical protein|nr:hypothetical protein [Burkholderiales bacterium]
MKHNGFARRARTRPATLMLICIVLCSALSDPAQARDEPIITNRMTVTSADIYERIVRPPAPSHALTLSLAYFGAAGWSAPPIIEYARSVAEILGQCAVLVSSLELHRIEGGAHYQYYETRRSRELARRIPLPRPAVYFVADTLQRPAFDAEAVGRANSRTRPELADTVWITREARDPAIVLAHELAHVLMDSGEHVDAPGNLMRDATDPGNVRLDASQCERLRDTGTKHRLLEPLHP